MGMDRCKDFRHFAISNGIGSSKLDGFEKHIQMNYPGVVIENANTRSIETNVYSMLMRDNIIFFDEEVTSESCDITIAQLLYMSAHSDGSDIIMYINSPGGSVIDGLGVIDTMNHIDTDVQTVCVGMAASMGAVLLSNGTKGKRSILPRSRVMIHSASSTMSGHTEDMRVRWNLHQELENDIYEILSANCGKSIEEIKDACNRDNWFKGQEAVDFGLVDQVIIPRNK